MIKPLVTESMVKTKGKVGNAPEAELVHKGGEGGTSHSIKTNSVQKWPKTNISAQLWAFINGTFGGMKLPIPLLQSL